MEWVWTASQASLCQLVQQPPSVQLLCARPRFSPAYTEMSPGWLSMCPSRVDVSHSLSPLPLPSSPPSFKNKNQWEKILG